MPESPVVVAGEAAAFELTGPVDVGSFTVESTVGRIIGPVVDIVARVREVDLDQLGRRVRLPARLRDGRFDNGRVLAELEARDPELGSVRDEQARVVQHDGGPPHVHVDDTSIPGGYHLGLYASGRYFPDGTAAPDGDHHHPGIAHDPDGDGGEPFTRILTASLGAIDPTR